MWLWRLMILKKMMVELAIGVLDKEVDKVAPPGDQICNQCKWRHLLAKFATNVSGTNLCLKKNENSSRSENSQRNENIQRSKNSPTLHPHVSICYQHSPILGPGLVPQDVRTSTASRHSWEKRNKEVYKVPANICCITYKCPLFIPKENLWPRRNFLPFLKYLEICDPSLTSYTGRKQTELQPKTKHLWNEFSRIFGQNCTEPFWNIQGSLGSRIFVTTSYIPRSSTPPVWSSCWQSATGMPSRTTSCSARLRSTWRTWSAKAWRGFW